MMSVGRGTGVGGLEHTPPEAPKAAPLRAGWELTGVVLLVGSHSSLSTQGQLNAVTCWEGMGWGLECAAYSWEWFLAFPTFPSLAGAGVSGWGWGRRTLEDISCLAGCAGLINVPKH